MVGHKHSSVYQTSKTRRPQVYWEYLIFSACRVKVGVTYGCYLTACVFIDGLLGLLGQNKTTTVLLLVAHPKEDLFVNYDW